MLGLLVPPHRAVAQGSHPLERVAMLDVALYNKDANLKEATDTARAAQATGVLRAALVSAPGIQLVDSSIVAAAEASSAVLAAAAGRPCNVIVACARAVGHTTGATWVVMAKVSKTSNLIWLLSGQLINVATGEIVLDDSTELKGNPETMVPAGVRIFAGRAARRAQGEAVSGTR